jgi:hypothetical protein
MPPIYGLIQFDGSRYARFIIPGKNSLSQPEGKYVELHPSKRRQSSLNIRCDGELVVRAFARSVLRSSLGPFCKEDVTHIKKGYVAGATDFVSSPVDKDLHKFKVETVVQLYLQK